MGPVWKTMLPLALVLVLVGFIAGALVTAGASDPPHRAPVDMVTAPTSGTTGTPTSRPSPDRTPSTRTPPTSGGVTVISPRPGGGGGGGDDDDDGSDDDGDDGDDERDDD